jgi:DNA helicase IV
VAKGLEFDRVVVVEPAAIAAAEPDERTGLRRLYVVLTRAVSALTVVHAEPLPGPLSP